MNNNLNFNLKGWLTHLKIWQKQLRPLWTTNLKPQNLWPLTAGSDNNRVVCLGIFSFIIWPNRFGVIQWVIQWSGGPTPFVWLDWLTKLAHGISWKSMLRMVMMVKGTRPQTVMTVKGPATSPHTNAQPQLARRHYPLHADHISTWVRKAKNCSKAWLGQTKIVQRKKHNLKWLSCKESA